MTPRPTHLRAHQHPRWHHCTPSRTHLPPRHSAPPTPRHASTLVELLVAIPLMALLTALAVALLISAQRAAQRADHTLAASHELRHAGAVLAAELRPLSARDLVTWSDTSIEFESTVGTGIACAGRGRRDRIELLPTTSADGARTSWVSPAQAGDGVSLFLAPTDSILTPLPHQSTLRTTSSTHTCTRSPLIDSSADPSAKTVTLKLVDTLPTGIAAGTPVRITRRIHYALYQSGPDWFLGRRELSPAGWDITQPVAGPLLSARAFGIVIKLRNAAGATLLPGDTTAATVHMELRAPARLTPTARSARTTLADSATIDITLRTATSGSR